MVSSRLGDALIASPHSILPSNENKVDDLELQIRQAITRIRLFSE